MIRPDLGGVGVGRWWDGPWLLAGAASGVELVSTVEVVEILAARQDRAGTMEQSFLF